MIPVEQSLQSLQAMLTEIAAFLPTLFGALLLIILGWLIAKLVRAGVSRLLRLVRFQQMSERSGVEGLLRQSYITAPLSAIVASLAYWFVIMVTVVMVANSLGLTVVAELFNRAALYLPNVIAAVVVLVIGFAVSRIFNRSLYVFLTSLEFDAALVVAKLAEYAMLVFVVFMALEQLQISTTLLHSAFQIAFGAVALAFALAFGLGGKDWAAGVIKKMTEKRG